MLVRDAWVFASDNGVATRPQGCCASHWHATAPRAALDPTTEGSTASGTYLRNGKGR